VIRDGAMGDDKENISKGYMLWIQCT